jgi:exodeoxyribonuclease VII small subunit
MVKNAQNEMNRLSYEQAFAELEQIVTRLETDSSSLDEALVLFERGQALSKHCAELLNQAELKVKKLLNTDELNDKGV